MQTSYTAYDTTGQTKLTDTDQLMEQRRREMADQAFRGALLNNQNSMQREGWDRQGAMTREGWGREDARLDQNMSAQERIAAANNANQLAMNGSYGDQSTQATKLAEMQMGPARMAQELEARKWGEGADLRNAQSGEALGLINMKKQILDGLRGGKDGVFGGGMRQAAAAPVMGEDPNSGEGTIASPAPTASAPWGGRGQMSPEYALALKLAFGIDQDSLMSGDDKMFRQMFRQQLVNGEIDQSQYKAAVSGDLSAIPKKQVNAIPLQQIEGDFDSDLSSYHIDDTDTLGSDPTQERDQKILQLRDQYARALKAENPRMTDAQALEAANYKAERKLSAEGVGWGDRQSIDRLRKLLGLSAQGRIEDAAKDMVAAYGPNSGMIRGGY